MLFHNLYYYLLNDMKPYVLKTAVFKPKILQQVNLKIHEHLNTIVKYFKINFTIYVPNRIPSFFDITNILHLNFFDIDNLDVTS